MTELSFNTLNEVQISKNRANLYHLIQQKSNRPAWVWHCVKLYFTNGPMGEERLSMEDLCRSHHYRNISAAIADGTIVIPN